MLEFGVQKSSNHWVQHLANFAKSGSLTAWQADFDQDFTQFTLRIGTRSLNNICNWYLGLQSWFSNLALIRHGLEDQSSPKRVVRLGFSSLTNWTDRQSGRPASYTARRVEVAVATRRQRPNPAGHDVPERGFNTPASARTQPCPHFPVLPPPSSPQRQPSASRLRRRHS
jgi:hypothetical protein